MQNMQRCGECRYRLKSKWRCLVPFYIPDKIRLRLEAQVAAEEALEELKARQ
jgi:hypothetical protein